MTILLQRLVEYAWVFYIACAVGVLIYVVRAISAHRARGLALFTLERETATSRLVQAWAMVLVFVLIGGAIFVVTALVLPGLPIYTPDATSIPSGLEIPTSTPTPSPSPTPGIDIPTLAPATVQAIPTPIPPAQTDTPVPESVPPLGAISGEVGVQFGSPAFAELVSYGLESAQVSTSQPFQLRLSWRALDAPSPANYVVFTHLRKQDASIVAQHDGPPAAGASPMLEWAPGEIIVDVHTMTFKEESRGYTGPATIIVGLYNPESPAVRVATSAGTDFVALPVTLSVVP